MASAAQEFDEWFRRDYRRVLGSVLVVCAGDIQRAEDATNQAFMKAFEQWHKVLLVDSRRAWVTKVAINAAKRSFMRRRRVESLNADAVLHATEDAWIDHQLWAAVNRLSRRQREAIVLRYIDDLSHAPIAAELNVAVGTAAATLSQARSKLRTDLEGDAP